LRSIARVDSRFLAGVAARSAALFASLLMGACSLGPASPTVKASPSPIESGGSGGTIAQDLTFTGKLPARWTAATATCGQAEGKGADSFSVKLTANDALGQTDTLTIVVGSGYKGPGEYSVDTTTVLSTGTPANAQIANSTPQLVTNFVVLLDKASGTIDSTMGHGSDTVDAIERVVGTWRCR
jgi:hypothetical protein